WRSDGLLLRDRALARALPRPRVRAGTLPAHRQVPAVPQPAIAADLHQPLDVHRDLLAEIPLDPADFLEHPADLPDVFLREILHADVGAHARLAEHVVRPLAADPVDIREADLDPLGARKIDAGYACHLSFVLLCSMFSVRVPGSSFGSRFAVRGSRFAARN